MKKKLFGITVLLLALCLLCACGKQKEEPSVEDPPATPFQNVYDDGGNLLVEYLVDDDGTYKGKKEYLYEEGQMKKRVYDKNDKLIEEIAEEYDAQGKLIRKAVYDSAAYTKDEIVYTYDAAGKLTEMAQTSIPLDGGRGWKTVRFYNEKEQPVRLCHYILDEAQKKATLLAYSDWEYEGDLKVKVTTINKNPYHRDYYIIHYDEAGLTTGVTYYDNNDKVKEKVTYERENGRVIKAVSSKGNYTVYHYDEKGNELGESAYDAEGKLEYTTLK